MSKSVLLSLLALLLFQGVAVSAPEAPKPWEHMVSIGASSSAGFGITQRLKGARRNIGLADLCDAMILKKHQAVQNLSSEAFFAQPREEGANEVKQALKAGPSAVLAVDFLFWFGYGSKGDEAREKDLEAGLGLLEKLSCPVIIAGLPDMTDAIGPMLTKDQVPAPDMLKKLNERIGKWASERANVILIPLCETHAAVRAGKGVKVGKCEWQDHLMETLFQPDRLHPTMEGLALIAAMSLESLQEMGKIGAGVFDLDAKAVTAKVYKAATGKDPPQKKP